MRLYALLFLLCLIGETSLLQATMMPRTIRRVFMPSLLRVQRIKQPSYPIVSRPAISETGLQKALLTTKTPSPVFHILPIEAQTPSPLSTLLTQTTPLLLKTLEREVTGDGAHLLAGFVAYQDMLSTAWVNARFAALAVASQIAVGRDLEILHDTIRHTSRRSDLGQARSAFFDVLLLTDTFMFKNGKALADYPKVLNKLKLKIDDIHTRDMTLLGQRMVALAETTSVELALKESQMPRLKAAFDQALNEIYPEPNYHWVRSSILAIWRQGNPEERFNNPVLTQVQFLFFQDH